jgi:hypothetical protein
MIDIIINDFTVLLARHSANKYTSDYLNNGNSIFSSC